MSGNGSNGGKARNRTAEKKAAFLEALAAKGSATHAAHAAGIGRRTAYDWKVADEEFAAEWKASIDSAIEELERALYERGKGWREQEIGEDGIPFDVGPVKYDTTAAIFWLKGHAPEKYKERSHVDGEFRLSWSDIVKAIKEKPLAGRRV